MRWKVSEEEKKKGEKMRENRKGGKGEARGGEERRRGSYLQGNVHMIILTYKWISLQDLVLIFLSQLGAIF